MVGVCGAGGDMNVHFMSLDVRFDDNDLHTDCIVSHLCRLGCMCTVHAHSDHILVLWHVFIMSRHRLSNHRIIYIIIINPHQVNYFLHIYTNCTIHRYCIDSVCKINLFHSVIAGDFNVHPCQQNP